jgi:outer membrane protein OmpA-like peptidoglycan-associated protein
MKNIAKTVIGASIIAAISGCSSPPKVAMPDGDARQPINSTAGVHDYEVGVALNKANREYQALVEQQIQAMNTEINQLKAHIKDLETPKPVRVDMPPITAKPAASVIRIKAVPAYSSTVQVKAVSDAALPAPSRTIGSVEQHANSVVFRVTEDFAKTDFKPSDEVKKSILAAAAQADAIEIRGRTDSEIVNPADRKIAIERANNARLFLISNGIASKKIRVTYLSAQGFVADNSTAEGKAQNRRVELEASGDRIAQFKQATDEAHGKSIASTGLPSSSAQTSGL